MGRAAPIRRRASHITLVVDTKDVDTVDTKDEDTVDTKDEDTKE